MKFHYCAFSHQAKKGWVDRVINLIGEVTMEELHKKVIEDVKKSLKYDKVTITSLTKLED